MRLEFRQIYKGEVYVKNFLETFLKSGIKKLDF